jgi:hypothetical protein
MHVGLALERQPGVTRRQYVVLRSDGRAGRVRLHQRWEIDVNPSWKREAGYGAVGLTGFNAVGEWTQQRVSYVLGVDVRKPVLPLELLDVADQSGFQRQAGVNGAVRLRLSDVRFVRVGADVRRRLETNENTYGWNASLAQQRLWSRRVSARVQASGFESASSRGAFTSAGIDVGAGNGTRVGCTGGVTWSEHQSMLAEPTDLGPQGWVRTSLGFQSTAGWWLDSAAEWRSAQVAEFTLQIGRAF